MNMLHWPDSITKAKAIRRATTNSIKTGISIFAEIKPHKKVSLFGRYDEFDPNDDADDDENTRYIVGAAYHIDKQHKNMVILDYDTVDYEQKDKTDDKRIQLTLQVAL